MSNLFKFTERKMNFIKHLIKLYCIFLFFSFINIECGPIIPDKDNKILVDLPNKDLIGQTLHFTFQLTSNLYYQQYIAVKFPESFASKVSLDQPNRFKCSLMEISNRKQIEVQDSPSPYEDQHIAFCQLTEKSKVLESKITYRLSLNLISINLSTSNFINNISLFTTTDTSIMRIIIDSCNFYGQIGLFSAIASPADSALTIISSSIVGATSIKIYTRFELSVTVKVNTLISKSSIILFRWPKDYVYQPHSCSNEKIADNDALRAALNGNIRCTMLPGTTDTMVLTGLMDDLPANRQFRIIFRGFQSLENSTTGQNIEVMSYYKNSYSQMGYSNSAVFKIYRSEIANFMIGHPDSWTIFANAAWPLQFSFSVDTSLPNGGYVLIQHTNYSSYSKLNFIASTCDFSKNDSSVSQFFGQRPVCAPLSPYVNNIDTSGNGIFFKLNSIWAGKTYYLNMFAFAEACGSSSLSSSFSSFVIFQFRLTIYKDLDMNQINHKRLIYDNNTILAQSSIVSANNAKCYSNVQLVNSLIPNNLYLSDSAGSTIDNIIFNELHNFSFSYFPTSKCGDMQPCYLDNINQNNSAYTQSYLQTDNITRSVSGSYFNIRAEVPFNIPNPRMRDLVATPIFIDRGTQQIQLQPGRLQLQWNKTWLTYGDIGKCWASWGAAWEKKNSDYTYTTLDTPTATQVTLNNVYSNLSKNFISQVGDTVAIDVEKTNFNQYLINSLTDSEGFKNFKFLADHNVQCQTSDCNHLNFSIYTTCYKFLDTIPNILSQYAYFDFQINFWYSTPSVLNRINRFFKFASNAIGFLDVNKVKTYPISQIYTFHGSVFPDSDNNNAVCLLQINKNTLLNSLGNDANTLIVYLNNLTPFEIDYSNVSSTYPAFPNSELSSVYSFTSQKLSSKLNLFTDRFELYQTTYNSNYLSTYYTYLGPYLIFTNTGKYYLKQDLLIPTYCPNSNNFSISLVWYQGNVDSYSTMTKVSLSIAMSDLSLSNLNHFQIRKLTGTKNQLNLTDINNTSVILPSYSASENDQRLYFKSVSNNIKCSGFSLLLNSMKLAQDGEIKLNIGNQILYGYTYSSQFMYIAFKKKFNQLIFSVDNSSYSVSQTQNSNLSNYYSGIKRPTLDVFVDDSGNPYIYDKIGFFCASNVSSEANLLSNLSTSFVTETEYKLGIQFSLDSTTRWPKINVNRDIYDSNYSSDPTSNLIIKFQTPIQLTKNLSIYLRFLTDITTENSTCSMIFDASNLECDILNYKIYEDEDKSYTKCSIPFYNNDFTIACYNINIDSQSIVIDNISVYLNDNIILQTFKSTDDRLTYVNLNYRKDYTIDMDSPYISDIFYEYSNQEYTFVKGIFTIKLPRGIVRGSQLIIEGDLNKFFGNTPHFGKFSIFDYIPIKCNVIAGKNLNELNVFTESCDISKIKPNDWIEKELIKISFKNMIYKINLKTPDTIYLSIYPMIANNISKTGEFTKLKVSWQLIDNTPISKSQETVVTWSNKDFFNLFSPIFQSNNLCTASAIYPVIANEEVEMTFVFDLVTNWENFISNASMNLYSPNEFLVYFDGVYFSLGDIVNCSTEDSFIQIYCSNLGDNILSIRMFNFLLTNQIYYIKVSSIKISSKFSNKNNNYKFLCSINNYDNSGIRIALLNGVGVISQPFQIPQVVGGLMIYDISSPNQMIRSKTSISFRFGFDTTFKLTDIPSLLKSNPYFLVTFPDDYPLINFYLLDLTCSMEISTGDISQQYPSAALIEVKYCELYGVNNIIVNIVPDMIVIDPKFRYFDLTINNIYTPAEPIASVGNFKVVISNDNNDYLYSSYNNLSTIYFNPLEKPLDPFINYYRGLSYSINNYLVKLDVYDPRTGLKNYLTIKTGRYHQFTLKFANNNLNLPKEDSLVTVDNNIFNIYEMPLMMSTYKKSVDFHFGTSCSTTSGIYYTNMALPVSKYMNKYIAITVKVDGTLGNISMTLPSSNLLKGSIFSIPIILSDYNFEAINLYFEADKNNNPNNSMPSVVSINPFTTNTYTTYTTEFINNSSDNFRVTSDNRCFEILQSQFILNVKTDLEVIENVTFSKENFEFLTGDKLPENTEKNSLVFSFFPPVNSGSLTCALVCYFDKYPPNNDLLNKNISNVPLVNVITKYFTSKNPIELKFSDLLRGQFYKMKCILQYKQTWGEELNKNVVTIEKYTNSKGIGEYIKTNENTYSYCVDYNFSNHIDITLMKKILNYCQNLFRDKPGCIKCVDNYGNMADGENFSEVTQCTTDKSKYIDKSFQKYNSGTYMELNYDPLFFTSIISNYAFYETIVNSTLYEEFHTNNFSYLVCTVQDKICTDDLSEKILSDSINIINFNLSSESMFYKTLGAISVPLLITNIKTDEVSPDPKYINIVGDPYIDTSGFFNVKVASYNGSLICYWILDKNDQVVTSFEIISCTDTSRCGVTKINDVVKDIYPETTKSLEIGNYCLYTVCYNDFPNASNKSDVYSLWKKFELKNDPGKEDEDFGVESYPEEESTSDTENSPTSNTTTSGSS